MSRTTCLALAACVAGTLALVACDRGASPAGPAGTATTAAPPAVAARSHAFASEITPGDFAEHVRVLASDAFEGRAPGSAGEEKTVAYLTAQFERMGLKPGNA